MVKMSRKRIVFLCSGGGGNLRFIYYACERKLLSNAEVVAVITDRDCAAKDFAIKRDISYEVVSVSNEDQSELLAKISSFEPDLIVTNIHKVLLEDVVRAFENKLINLHYSLLPSFAGLIGAKPVAAAIQQGYKFSGATAHFVDEHVDAGKPITQVAVPILQDEDLEQCMQVIFRCGCIALLSAINYLSRTNEDALAKEHEVMNVFERHCIFSGFVYPQLDKISEEFWSIIN